MIYLMPRLTPYSVQVHGQSPRPELRVLRTGEPKCSTLLPEPWPPRAAPVFNTDAFSEDAFAEDAPMLVQKLEKPLDDQALERSGRAAQLHEDRAHRG